MANVLSDSFPRQKMLFPLHNLGYGIRRVVFRRLCCIMGNHLWSKYSESAESLFPLPNDKHWRVQICTVTVIARTQFSAILLICMRGIALPLKRFILMCSDLHYVSVYAYAITSLKKSKNIRLKYSLTFECDFFFLFWPNLTITANVNPSIYPSIHHLIILNLQTSRLLHLWI